MTAKFVAVSVGFLVWVLQLDWVRIQKEAVLLSRLSPGVHEKYHEDLIWLSDTWFG
jgi:hypothetical protein